MMRKGLSFAVCLLLTFAAIECGAQIVDRQRPVVVELGLETPVSGWENVAIFRISRRWATPEESEPMTSGGNLWRL
jgi:hypothetical protein